MPVCRSAQTRTPSPFFTCNIATCTFVSRPHIPAVPPGLPTAVFLYSLRLLTTYGTGYWQTLTVCWFTHTDPNSANAHAPADRFCCVFFFYDSHTT